MRTPTLHRHLIGIAAAATLAGCGVPTAQHGLPPEVPGATRQSRAPATTGDLMYAVSSNHSFVYVLTYPKIKLIDTIGGFSPAALRGVCSDEAGNVYVVDQGSVPQHTQSHVFVFRHGETNPNRVLKAPSGIRNCAVNSSSGDLAVITDTNSPTLALYHHGRGSPTLYNGGPFSAGAYGANGRLYLVTPWPTGQTVAVLDHHPGSAIQYLNLDRNVPWAGNAQWNRGTLVVTAQARGEQQFVYVIKPQGAARGKVVQISTLERRTKEVPRHGLPDQIEGDTLIAPGPHSGLLDFWEYPKGGEPEGSAKVKIDGYFNSFTVSRGN
ncbi:MAG TPA: hypothetical protein VMU38_06605 [Candidatus Binatia bacterium]|nr:hypothetical protein [Candidatus Binatia bacterium]